MSVLFSGDLDRVAGPSEIFGGGSEERTIRALGVLQNAYGCTEEGIHWKP
jgi:hypothetical protein